ncbi:Thymidine kinase 2-like 1 [Homarus americanus]|uniref:Thymidine kinase 2-like 1 n=1 Tax=Homarus americanus TaxID=6706 RepID=A0A8J5JPP9_HOMAM|nr:Thymidine kinase 2-like 1 [Homarus americanus]
MKWRDCWEVLVNMHNAGTQYLAGNIPKRRAPNRMCSKVLTESTIKVAVTEDSSMEFLEGCSLDESTTRKLLVDSHLSPPKRNFHSRSIMSSSKTGMSPLPASLILQKSFGFIASEMPSEMKMRSRPFTVSIEGNIGSGKSTFLQYFSATPGVATHQSYVQLTRLNIHLQQSSSPVKLIERSLQNNRYCFLESGHDCGHLKEPEYSVLCEYYDLLESKLDIGIDLIVYLRTTPEVVHSRMMKRGRSEEADVPLKYLKVVHSYYEKWLLNHLPCAPPAPVLVIDANQELEEVRKEYDLKKPVIMGEKSI